MVPLSSLVKVTPTLRPGPRACATTATPPPTSTAARRRAIRRARRRPRWSASPHEVAAARASSYEWTDLTYQEILAGNAAMYVFPLCVLLVFLVLAAQYESWTLPLAVILIVPMCVLSALARRLADRRRQQHLHADRLVRAGRPGVQERDPDRGVRA